MRIEVSRRWGLRFLVVLVVVCAIWAVAMAAVEGLGTVAGKVSAPKAFRAAQVYLRNIDKHTLYMVYTADGRYEAPNLLPGNYEVSVKKDGFVTEVKKLTVTASANLTADFALQEGSYTPAQLTVFNGPAGARSAKVQVAYNDLYPPGPGKAVVERTCVSCHGVNFLPGRQWTQGSATAAINLMTGAGVNSGRGIGTITPEMMNPQEREQALSYIVANFGRD